MADVRADGIAVYLYLRPPSSPALEFLQIRRTMATGEYQQSWQIVYGGIEPGETALQAALREIKEEIGLSPAHLRDMFQVEFVETFYFRPKDYVLMMPVWAAEVAPDAPIALNEEHDAFRWTPLERVPTDFMWRDQREAIRIVTEEVLHPGPARHFLSVDLSKLR